jgi:para-aminobenzoate synthetase component 2
MILIVDNFDSFVFNVARYFRELGAEVEVARNDAVSVEGLAASPPEAIVISPGPCAPEQAGASLEIIRALSGRIPILGVCLGHQCIGAAFGGKVERAQRPLHGRASAITHQGRGVFEGLPSPLSVGRYHSLIVTGEMPDLRVDARSEEGEIMGLSHRTHPTWGVQFHPESVLTEHGHAIFGNFLALARSFNKGGGR